MHVIIPFNFPVPKEEQDFYLEENYYLKQKEFVEKQWNIIKELVKTAIDFLKWNV